MPRKNESTTRKPASEADDSENVVAQDTVTDDAPADVVVDVEVVVEPDADEEDVAEVKSEDDAEDKAEDDSDVEADPAAEDVADSDAEADEISTEAAVIDEYDSIKAEQAPAPSDEVVEAAASEATEQAEVPPPRRTRRNRRNPAAIVDEEAPIDAEATAAEAPERPKRNYRDTVISRTRREEERTAQRKVEESFRSSWAAMVAAKEQNIVLEGKIFGVSELYHEDPRINANVGEAMLTLLVNNSIKVTMPFFEFYSRHPVAMDTVDLSTPAGRRSYLSRQMNMARKLIGITVPFVITDMVHGKNDDYDDNDHPTYAIVASRKKALAILARRNFASINGSQPVYKEGDVVQADIVSVAPHALQVNVGGVDARLPVASLTFKLVNNATKVYRSGGQVMVKIRRITVDKNGLYELELSGRDVELLEAKKRHFLLETGMCVHGVFININQRDDGFVTAIAYLPDVGIPAMVRRFAPRSLGAAPRGGDEATLVVVGFHQTGFVITNCTGILNDSPSTAIGF